MKSKNPVKINDVFGRLTVVAKTIIQENVYRPNLKIINLSASVCVCECGKQIITKDNYLKMGHTKSCGCLLIEKRGKATITHGMTNTKIYRIYEAMHDRCYLQTSKSYLRYGGRGIKICEKWHTFEGFFEDMGATYQEGLSIERIDTNGDYCKENCTWIPKNEQAKNKRNNILWFHEGNWIDTNEFAKILNVRREYLLKKRQKARYTHKRRYEDG